MAYGHLLTIIDRLIIYYPVSALVTLFANILQNPNDARARSDVKLMNVVVNFLSTLVSDESNGSIKRMLSLCGEFERIAKVVLDKNEKESHARKKRKNAAEDTAPGAPGQDQAASSPQTANPQGPSTTLPFSPSRFTNDATTAPTPRGFGVDPTINTVPGDLPSNVQGMPTGQDFADMLSPNQMGNVGFGEQPFTSTSPNISPFQQPFVPQDLWQMPMTIEWDWADMSSNFPVFESGGGPNGQPPLQ